jgi:orotidine-5'-phosphate decarboxylase
MFVQDTLDWLIWSADVDPNTMFANLRLLPKLIVKVDRDAVEEYGFGLIDRLVEEGYLVFDDAKLAEIPIKVERMARRHVGHKPWMLNCMAGNQSSRKPDGKDKDALFRFADVCNEAGVLSCGVTVLTSTTEAVVKAEYNGRSSIEQVLYYTEALIEAKFTDVVCSPLEAEAIIREFGGTAINTNCPGIRMPDAPPDDQARTMTPQQARRAGVWRLVVGRPLTDGDIVANFQALKQNYEG